MSFKTPIELRPSLGGFQTVFLALQASVVVSPLRHTSDVGHISVGSWLTLISQPILGPTVSRPSLGHTLGCTLSHMSRPHSRLCISAIFSRRRLSPCGRLSGCLYNRCCLHHRRLSAVTVRRHCPSVRQSALSTSCVGFSMAVSFLVLLFLVVGSMVGCGSSLKPRPFPIPQSSKRAPMAKSIRKASPDEVLTIR